MPTRQLLGYSVYDAYRTPANLTRAGIGSVSLRRPVGLFRAFPERCRARCLPDPVICDREQE